MEWITKLYARRESVRNSYGKFFVVRARTNAVRYCVTDKSISHSFPDSIYAVVNAGILVAEFMRRARKEGLGRRARVTGYKRRARKEGLGRRARQPVQS
jgi:hypothetical protein